MYVFLYVGAYDVTQKNKQTNKKARIARSCGGKVRMQGDRQLTELSALQCFSLRRHASSPHRVGSAPCTHPQRGALMLEARCGLHLQNRLVSERVSSFPLIAFGLFDQHAVEEAAGLGILAGTSPLQHFFFGRQEGGEGGRGGRRTFDGSLHLPVKRRAASCGNGTISPTWQED